jgi:error-prone DNA polymerase
MTLEDETGIANIVVWPKLFEQFRAEVLGGRLVAIDGPVQKEGDVIHVVAECVHDWTSLLAKLSGRGAELDPGGPTDEPRRGRDRDAREKPKPEAARHPRNVRLNLDVSPAASVMPKGRNFH